MKAFITGSHAYGTPRDDSDVDLVVCVDAATAEELTKLFAPKGLDLNDFVDAEPNADEYGTLQFREGRLNLILCDTEERYESWRRGTAELVARKPVSRDEAIAHLKALREEVYGKAKKPAEVVP